MKRSELSAVAGIPRRLGSALPIVAATLVLLAASPFVAAGSLGGSALATTVPFAAILAVATVGQTLVIQQGGLDFAVPGVITVSVVLLTRVAGQRADRLPLAIGVTLAVAVATGLVAGLLVARWGLTPLIATLGVNAVLLGVVHRVSGGLSVVPAPAALTRFCLDRTLGVFNLLLVAVAVLAVWTVLVKRTVPGRRFEVVGANAAAARVAGIRVALHRTAAYVLAAVCYATAGVLLAGFLQTPSLNIGDSYLLATIAAVVVGGTALGGGPGNALASAVGALFLTQLSQLLLSTGAPTSVNYLVQGLVIGASVGLRIWLPRLCLPRFGRSPRQVTA